MKNIEFEEYSTLDGMLLSEAIAKYQKGINLGEISVIGKKSYEYKDGNIIANFPARETMFQEVFDDIGECHLKDVPNNIFWHIVATRPATHEEAETIQFLENCKTEVYREVLGIFHEAYQNVMEKEEGIDSVFLQGLCLNFEEGLLETYTDFKRKLWESLRMDTGHD